MPSFTSRVLSLGAANVPLIGSNVTVAFHLAWKVTCLSMTVLKSTREPPVWEVYHPAMVNPARVPLGKLPICVFLFTSRVVWFTVPP